jgi:hypothetical protein
MRSYTPVVKAKKNDLGALSALTATAKAGIFPLVESPITINGSTLATQCADAAAVAARLMGDSVFFFDPLGIEGPARQLLAFRTLVDSKANFVPTLGLARPLIPLQELTALVDDTKGRFAVRLESDDIEDAENSWDSISRLTSALDTSPADVTLILDFAQLNGKDIDELRELVLDFLACQPRHLSECKLILIGSSALNTVAGVPLDGELDVARRELSLWTRVSFELADSRRIRFGDYGIVDPSFVFAGGPSGNANAKIRYTRGGKTRYFRGHGLYKPNRFAQYHDLAARVVASSDFLGAEFSYGDKRIADCAAQSCRSGNLATWVQADLNHHVEYTAHQIARVEPMILRLASESEIRDLLALD